MKEKVISIPTQEISRIVQEKLFELGYTWCGKKIFLYLYCDKETYLCLNENKMLGYCSSNWCLKRYPNEHEEITMYDLFQMEKESDTIELTTKDGEVIEISRKSLEGLRKLK